MNNEDLKKLCMALVHADAEAHVIDLLKQSGFWDSPECWRYYGDTDNNFSNAGNQQSRSETALVEKLVNSIDARLMNECLASGVDPTGPGAPTTIREAVARFVEKHPVPASDQAGRVREWSGEKRTAHAMDITLTATGQRPKGKPCFTISDKGEGQTPLRMPETILSLDRKNKQNIPFVQGKFNMGGTGVLRFCGKTKMQLVVSRRNPALLSKGARDSTDHHWGFTVVRREDPEGGGRNSVYTYLAPVGAKERPRRGEVLSFAEDQLPIFPERNRAYARQASWGTLVKLYEYTNSGYSNSHILRRDGLFYRIDLLLPELALPIRFHECRDFGGHSGSFDTTLSGLSVRLFDDKSGNLEADFPTSCPMTVANERMHVTIYAFKPDADTAYRKNEGVIFTVNGQTHGHLTTDFFRRKAVNLSYLWQSILVVIDCSDLSHNAREELFMNSRDRLSGHDIRYDIERELEEVLRHQPGLRALAEKRRREEVQTKLKDNKALKDVLETLIRKSPALAALFMPGSQLANPFKPETVQQSEKQYSGLEYPTTFHFKGKEQGQRLSRECPLNTRCRISFETDAVNHYFSQELGKGRFQLFTTQDGNRVSFSGYAGPNLHNGIGTLSLELPLNCKERDAVYFVAEITDDSRIDPFENEFTVTVTDAVKKRESRPGERRKPPSTNPGDDRDAPSAIDLPEPTPVFQGDWKAHKPPFDRYTALRVKQVTEGESRNGGEKVTYDFLVNMDNVHLLSFVKTSRLSADLLRKRFAVGLTLIGLGLIQDNARASKSEQESSNTQEQAEMHLEDKIEEVTRAVAPFLLPMIETLGTLDEEENIERVPELAGEAA